MTLRARVAKRSLTRTPGTTSRTARLSAVVAVTLFSTFLGLTAFSSTAGTQPATGPPVWRQLAPPVVPPARDRAAIAFDPSPDRPGEAHVVLFGGFTDGGPADDTWIWRNGAWTQAQPVNRPPARFGASMAFDGRQVVLFGGEAPTPTPADPARDQPPGGFLGVDR